MTGSEMKSFVEHHRQRECDHLLYLFRHLRNSHLNLFFPLAMPKHHRFLSPFPSTRNLASRIALHIFDLLESDIGELLVDHWNFWNFLDCFD